MMSAEDDTDRDVTRAVRETQRRVGEHAHTEWDEAQQSEVEA